MANILRSIFDGPIIFITIVVFFIMDKIFNIYIYIYIVKKTKNKLKKIMKYKKNLMKLKSN